MYNSDTGHITVVENKDGINSENAPDSIQNEGVDNRSVPSVASYSRKLNDRGIVDDHEHSYSLEEQQPQPILSCEAWTTLEFKEMDGKEERSDKATSSSTAPLPAPRKVFRLLPRSSWLAVETQFRKGADAYRLARATWYLLAPRFLSVGVDNQLLIGLLIDAYGTKRILWKILEKLLLRLINRSLQQAAPPSLLFGALFMTAYEGKLKRKRVGKDIVIATIETVIVMCVPGGGLVQFLLLCGWSGRTCCAMSRAISDYFENTGWSKSPFPQKIL